MTSFTETYLARVTSLVEILPVADIERVIDMLWDAYERAGRVFVMGNGGSAAAASHFVCDLAKGAIVEGMPRVKALCLTDNVPLITAWANDTLYTNIFGEILRNHCEPGDLLIGCTASGMSPNIINAMRVANELGAGTVALVGYDGGDVKGVVEHSVVIPSDNITQIEDVQMLLFHLLASALRARIVGASEGGDADSGVA
jgi:D-sedoheptulose 7-phosphate isomerase